MGDAGRPDVLSANVRQLEEAYNRMGDKPQVICIACGFAKLR